MVAKGSARERYRAQVIDEIKAHAWEQIASAGMSAMSLNAIAKHVGMSGPGLYRYFAGRDELITALIGDAYRSLADTMRAAVDAGADVAALANSVREWSLNDPQRYFLIYGTPVPGYHAPDDTTRISSEIMTVLIEVLSALPVDRAPTEFDTHLAGHRDWADDDTVSEVTLHRCLSFWTRLHGVLSLELAGHFAGMGFDPALLFADELKTLDVLTDST